MHASNLESHIKEQILDHVAGSISKKVRINEFHTLHYTRHSPHIPVCGPYHKAQ